MGGGGGGKVSNGNGDNEGSVSEKGDAGSRWPWGFSFQMCCRAVPSPLMKHGSAPQAEALRVSNRSPISCVLKGFMLTF